MNYQTGTIKRLLKLYPVSSLRKEFNIKVTGQEHVIQEIVTQNAPQTIIDFAKTHFDITKQHIYLLETDKNIDFGFNVVGLAESVTLDNILNAKNSATCFVPIEFTVFETKKNQVSKLEFLWPIRLQYFYNNKTKKYIFLLKITVLEREIGYFYENKVFVTNRSLEEKELVKSILDNFTKNACICTKLDLNKGIKELAELDIIDFPSAKYRKSKSITTEIMDEDFTIKKNNPDVYEYLMKSPLERTTCKLTNPQKEEVDYFRVEPLEGKISFSTYSPAIDSVDNIISLILNNNF